MSEPINLNVQVEVVLTEAGVRQLEAYAKALGLPPGYDSFADKQIGDTYRSQLWELFQIFGPIMFNGCKVPFVGNCFTIVGE